MRIVGHRQHQRGRFAAAPRRDWRPRQRYDRGFILIALLALLAMGVLYFVTTQLEAVSLYQRESKGESDSLAQAREALLGYAATYRDTHSDQVFGYLPCPDTASKTGIEIPGDGNAASNCGNAGEASVGLLPYKTLGLPDLRDSSGSCLWYVVSGNFKNNSPMVPVNWDTQGEFTIVGTVAPNDANGGAAAVIIAPGPALSARATNGNGPCSANPADIAAFIESYNSATATFTPGTANTSNNDRLAWITPREIFDRVVKRQDFSNALTASPPGQINTLIDRLTKALDKKIQDDIFGNGTPTTSLPNTAGYTPQTNVAAMGAVMGAVNASASDIALGTVSYTTYRTNWLDQFRQIVCNSLGTPCLTINSSGCRGALLFGGRNAANQLRTGAPSIVNLASYFENTSNGDSTGGLDLLTGVSSVFSGNTSFINSLTNPPGKASTDVATCLGYGTFDSLKQSSAAFAGGVINPGGAGTGVATVTGVATATPAIVLGSGTATANSGCVWRPSPLPLNSSLRLYFTYSIASAFTSATPRGFTLALADAATNNPASVNPLMCGASGSSSLGYAGAPGSGTATVGVSSANITATAWSIGVATIATAAPHGFSVGNVVTVSGAVPTGYNGARVITSAGTSSFTFDLLSDPGAPLMGIFPPKIGVEFDLSSNASRNDPAADHFAFVYWGGASDNNPNPSANPHDGGDDNVHKNGVNGDGSQPLNPGNLSVTAATATPVSVVTAARWVAGTATITTAAPHGFIIPALPASPPTVTISNVSPLGYKGAYNLVSVPNPTSFTYALAGDPGAFPYVATVAAATWASNTAAITTSAAHGLSTGQRVTISNVSPAPWNGGYTVTVQDATHFSFTVAVNPGSYISGGQVSFPLSAVATASWTGGTVTMTTSAMHGLASNQFVTISGISPSAYNGTYRINVSAGNQFTYALAGNPGAYSSGGSIAIAGATSTVMASPVVASTLTSAVWAPDASAGKVTVTSSLAHGLATGQTVQIAGVYPPAYNGAYAITVIDATHFSYALASDPGAAFSASTFAYPGSSTVKTHFFQTPPNTPLDTLIHVRVDISRGYDASRHQATLTLKAYVGDNFSYLAWNCALADFKNFARDLGELCPMRPPTIEQDGITINDAAGPALANIYLGFTTARSAAAGDNEYINIQNLILRSQ